MSALGKSTLSIRKKDVLQQRNNGTGYRRLVFAHRATIGETGVDFTNLTQPPEMASLGFTNPNTADILAANVLFYKKNLTVISSARGVLIQDLSYTVPTSSRIEFQGFTSLENEIFTFLIETGVRDGINVVDADPIVATGELPVAQTDFNVGIPFEVNKNSAQQIGAVLVFRNSQLQVRNPGNGVSGGDYQEVDGGGGLGTVIRFNVAPIGTPDDIVVWGQTMAERPDGSMTAAIESLAGQIDAMIPDLATLASVPPTNYQAAPNNQDLKAFGDRVLGLEEPGSPGSPLLSTTTVAGAQLKNKVQTKILGSDITSDGVIAALTFNNLVVGKWYEVSGTFRLFTDNTASDEAVRVYAVHDSSNINMSEIVLNENTDSTLDSMAFAVSFKFQATATTLTFVANSTTASVAGVAGDGTRGETYVQIEERNDLEVTTDFT